MAHAQRAFLEDHHLFVGVRVRRMRGRVRVERGDVHLELVERARRLLHHFAPFAHVRLLRFEVAPLPGGGVEQATLIGERDGG